jgi:hypothetical protein
MALVIGWAIVLVTIRVPLNVAVVRLNKKPVLVTLSPVAYLVAIVNGLRDCV